MSISEVILVPLPKRLCIRRRNLLHIMAKRGKLASNIVRRHSRDGVPKTERRAPRRVENMVVDALQIEPVSKLKFPANREINREFCRFRPLARFSAPNREANSVACS
jgi:hypothetical protein